MVRVVPLCMVLILSLILVLVCTTLLPLGSLVAVRRCLRSTPTAERGTQSSAQHVPPTTSSAQRVPPTQLSARHHIRTSCGMPLRFVERRHRHMGRPLLPPRTYLPTVFHVVPPPVAWTTYRHPPPDPVELPRPRPPAVVVVPPDPRSDPQNVHDVAVQASLKSNIEAAVGPAGGVGSATGDEQQVRETARRMALECGEEVSPVSKHQALEVIDNLNTNTHSRLGLSEISALDLVLRRMAEAPEHVRANLRETLVKQLAGCVERGNIVCSTGKISRIVGTLDGTELGLTPLVPLWAVRDDIGTKAAHIRDTYSDSNEMKEALSSWVKASYGTVVPPEQVTSLIQEFQTGFD